MRNHCNLAAQFVFLSAVGALSAPTASAGPLLTNGNFEAGLTAWTVVDQAGGSGSWFAQTGTTSPLNSFAVPAPPQGVIAAMTDQGGPGAHALLQSFTVPLGTAQVILSFLEFVGNRAGGFSTPNSLDFTGGANQQARVSILTAAAGAFDVGAGVVANVFQTNVGDPLVSGYNLFSMDITSVVSPGGTYQIRFAETDNQLFFNFGVDSVSIEATTIPEPATIWGLGSGLIGLGLLRRRAKFQLR